MNYISTLSTLEIPSNEFPSNEGSLDERVIVLYNEQLINPSFPTTMG